jgi:hypothetical protein
VPIKAHAIFVRKVGGNGILLFENPRELELIVTSLDACLLLALDLAATLRGADFFGLGMVRR